MDISDNSSSDGEGYIEIEETITVTCLFCSHNASSYEEMFEHILTIHGINFIDKCKLHHLDTFQFIKLINYIREHKNSTNDDFENIIQNKLFDSDKYLKPFVEDDSFLMFDYESEIEKNNQSETFNMVEASEEDIQKYLKNYPKENLVQEVIRLSKRLKEVNGNLDKMRNLFIHTEEDHINQIIPNGETVTTLDEKGDSDYIESYSHYSIHHVMLADKPRTLAYQDAIMENSSFFKDKIVLDIGCGVGILSLFAAKAGARIVVGVDHSNIVYNAKSIIYENGYDEKIKIVKGKLEQIDFAKLNLPTKYDIIISEWMGYFLLFEGMLETILFARDNLLEKQNGVLLPSKCKLFLSAFSDCLFYEKNIDFWRDVYGFDMSSMIADVTCEAAIDLINPENICASSEKICDFHISRCTTQFINDISANFQLNFKNDSTIHGFVGWFDCYFESISKQVVLSTSPFSEPTHWKQTIFPLKEPVLVKSGQTINGTINIQKSETNPRNLKVKIQLNEQNLKLVYNIC